MAKSPASTAAAAAPAAAAAAPVSAFAAPVIRFGDAPAAIERKVGGDKSPYAALMEQLPLPDKGRYAQFFVPSEQPAATITDAGERAKQAKENARKLSNKLSGLTRRVTKKNKDFVFALRTKEENGVLGVVVYRVEAPAPAAPTA